MTVTILKRKEMAEVLNMTEASFKKALETDPKLPVVKIGQTVRFVKQNVLNYLGVKKNMDRITGTNQPDTILDTSRDRTYRRN